MSDLYVTGMPGVSAERLVSFRRVFRGFSEDWLSGGKQIDGAFSRDPSNTGNVNVLQPGLVMGRIGPAGGAYAPSIYGLTSGALAGGGTSIAATAAVIAEILRRKGGTGTVKLTGPPTPGGVVRTQTVTYSALGATTATITAPGVNEVQQVNFNVASTGGNVTLLVPKPTGVMQQTTPIAWSATDATYLASINAALDAATGVVGGIVATAIPATDTDLGFVLTYSGAGYAGAPQPLAQVVGTLPTSSTAWNVTRTTTGVNGAFVAGSFIQPTDGSENPLTFISDVTGPVLVTDPGGNGIVVPFHRLPIRGEVDAAQLINWPADASLQAWLMNQLSTASGGKFVFGDQY